MLTLCPTPIGNLDDVTPRQRAALAGADILACEDTRTTGRLLELLGLLREGGRPRLVSYHDHNERGRADELIAAMLAGQRVVLVSDAGTPTLSDPGFRLVRAAHEAGVRVEVLPGAAAAIVALAASGLPTDRFFFEGFLPARAVERRARLAFLQGLSVTAIVYEAPHRVIESLEDIAAVFGPRHVCCVARELTKLHEEVRRGEVAALLERERAREPRGEYVLVLGPYEAVVERLEGEALHARIRDLLAQGMRTKQVREALLSEVELSSSALYTLIEQIKNTAG
jgi:16S rRNA (cytidine1402-2'-O)-methyltransferase